MNKILFVIVIYRIRKEQSVAWTQLNALLGADADSIYVHDNTANNVYLAKAYNEGLRYAKQKGYTWVALLDADTQVTQEYITAVNQTVMTQCPDSVYCPALIGKNGKQLSPLRAYGIPVAFNSGLLIPVTIMDTLGGFNEAYPLDYLDYWLCYQLQQRHIALKPLEVRLQHALSVQDYAQMPEWRYRSLLESEKRFAQESGNEKRYRWLLFCRLIKWALTGHPYVKETYRAWRER